VRHQALQRLAGLAVLGVLVPATVSAQGWRVTQVDLSAGWSQNLSSVQGDEWGGAAHLAFSFGRDEASVGVGLRLMGLVAATGRDDVCVNPPECTYAFPNHYGVGAEVVLPLGPDDSRVRPALRVGVGGYGVEGADDSDLGLHARPELAVRLLGQLGLTAALQVTLIPDYEGRRHWVGDYQLGVRIFP